MNRLKLLIFPQRIATISNKDKKLPKELADSSLIGHAFEYDDGIYVVDTVMDNTVYLIGPDDEIFYLYRRL